MKIVMVSNYYSRHRGGIEIVAGRLSRELSMEQAMSVSWFAAGQADSVPPAPGVRMIEVPAYNWLEDRFGIPYPVWRRGIRTHVDREAEEADVVMVHDALYHGSRCVERAARRHAKPVVVVQHIGVVPYKNALPRAAIRAGNRFIAEPLLARAAQVVFVSESVRRFYLARNVEFRREPRVIFNGVDTDIFSSWNVDKRRAAREELGLPLHRHVILFVGRFVEKKGLAVIRELVRNTPDALWVLAGWGVLNPDSWGQPNLRTIRDRVGPQLAALYQAADMLVLPSFGEGFPLVVQEALATGLMVFAGLDTADADGEVSGFIRGLEVKPGNARSTAATWISELQSHLRTHAPLTYRLQAAADLARARWSWAAVGRKYAEMLHAL